MKLVFLSNFYPPFSHGGYEEWCREVAEGLRRRGHDVLVLTSRAGLRGALSPGRGWVRRDLSLQMSPAPFVNSLLFLGRGRGEKRNRARLRQIVLNSKPDLCVVWGMWNLSRSLAAEAERLMPGRVAYYIADYWPTLPSQLDTYWRVSGRSRVTEALKRLLAPLARSMLARDKVASLTFAHTMFPSEFLREELKRRGMVWEESRVIRGGVDTDRFAGVRRSFSSPPGESVLSLLYAGRLVPEKGVHTAIRAVQRLVQSHGVRDIRFTIAGTGPAEVVRDLHALTRKAKLERVVRFLGKTRMSEMPELYATADVVLFPSVWAEPFGRVLVEAMASGAVVLATATGGAAEILEDGENCLTFPPDDDLALTTCLARLRAEPQLRRRLAEGGRRAAQERWDLGRMLNEIEEYLGEIMSRR